MNDNSFEIAQSIFELQKRIEELERYRNCFIATIIFALMILVSSLVVLIICVYEYDKRHVK